MRYELFEEVLSISANDIREQYGRTSTNADNEWITRVSSVFGGRIANNHLSELIYVRNVANCADK